jgi:hypothetical protein
MVGTHNFKDMIPQEKLMALVASLPKDQQERHQIKLVRMVSL